MEKSLTKSKINTGRIIPLVFIGFGLLIIGIVAAVVLINQSPVDTYSVVPSSVNFPAPELVFNDLSGKKVSISDYRGNIVMINNWATWCPPCKAEMPTLSKYYQSHKDQGFILFGIDAGDPTDSVKTYVNEYKVSFPVLLDPNTRSLALFHNDSLPSSYVIDHNGNVVLAWSGPISMDMLEKYVTPLLEQ